MVASESRPSHIANTIDNIEFCLVYRGPCQVGDTRRSLARNEVEPCIASLPYDFWLARLPVTAAMIREYLAMSNNRLRVQPDYDAIRSGATKLMMELAAREWHTLDKIPDNHPVTGITWDEAQIFCKWLSNRWHTAGWLDKSWVVQLPSDAEWEKAARGGLRIPVAPQVKPIQSLTTSAGRAPQMTRNPMPGREFPWGDGGDGDLSPILANFGDVFGGTVPVGSCPAGTSPYGVEDLAGNIFEWTRSRMMGFAPFDFGWQLDNDGDIQTVRGGCWSSSVKTLRCSFRDYFHRDGSLPFVGVRLTLVPRRLFSDDSRAEGANNQDIERCSIVYKRQFLSTLSSSHFDKARFIACIGSRTIAKSPVFTTSDHIPGSWVAVEYPLTKEAAEALQTFLNLLAKEGWQPIIDIYGNVIAAERPRR